MGRAERIGVVGAGLMGREIALVFALAGYDVLLADQSMDLLDGARARLAEIIQKAVARGLYQESDAAALDRIATTTDLEQFFDRDFVTEAVFEQESTKAKVFERLDAACKQSCVIATNTSTIPISVLASHVGAERRSRFVGTHYFSPVSRMKLVEVMPGIETSPETVETAMRLCREVGKTPIAIKDVPGFAVNRLLHVLMIEAVRLVEEGVATPEDIDTACRLGLGHPLGPFELMDATTSSLCLQAQQIMFEAYGERFRPRPLLKQRVQAGYGGGRGKPGWRNEVRR
ncbi:3-hydroxyacyl-CoA dehydrogenase family protein [Bosea sp. (in: a-proteobacteria)]|uniref:3-hydroxyacyl-CoA dehydrogenase family protein n=1 Tax=Bosea sp. (in: a-proteobacteria) TaxID=1871050 RepID=UPI00262B4CA6|nr:3-hydroxyacyl-CoA dehydrogenase family protein [Bosea sp. (in: a-proteobacteria)]MCO5089649.1 3-hydroxyacyl-CoA dehydrogenase family protein [Bosea sp. (in: a-proteobacteria)]